MKIEKQYDRVGSDYILGQEKFFTKKEDKAIKFIKKNLPNLKNKTLLDIGCGVGKDIRLYESLGSTDIYGIDSSKYMISQAKKYVQKSDNLFVASIEKMPFKNNFFDIIVGRYSFHYLKKTDKAFKEISRILKPNGILILVVQHPLKDYILKKNKEYTQQKIITIKLFNNKVNLSFPSHTFKDYFSEQFFKEFYLEFFDEEKTPESGLNKNAPPGFMGIKAVKKISGKHA